MKKCLFLAALAILFASCKESPYEEALSLLDDFPEDAAVLLERAAATEDHEVDSRLQLALLYEKKDETSALAAWHLRKCLELDPRRNDRESIEAWILRCEKAYAQHLRKLLGDGGLQELQTRNKLLEAQTLSQKQRLEDLNRENYKLRHEMADSKLQQTNGTSH